MRFFHFFLMYYYCFGEVKNTHFRILADVGRALFFEVGAAIIFYWYQAFSLFPSPLYLPHSSINNFPIERFIAVSAATNRQRMYGFLRVPVLAITGVILLVWICVGNFGLYSTNKSGNSFYFFSFVFLICFPT